MITELPSCESQGGVLEETTSRTRHKKMVSPCHCGCVGAFPWSWLSPPNHYSWRLRSKCPVLSCSGRENGGVPWGRIRTCSQKRW
jgi:hypothetical protein